MQTTPEAKRRCWRVGFCVTEAKMGKLGWGDVSRVTTVDHDSVIIPLSPAALSTADVDVLVFKLTDQIAMNQQEDIKAIESYLLAHPSVVQVDPIPVQQALSYRDVMCDKLSQVGAVLQAKHVGRAARHLIVSDPRSIADLPSRIALAQLAFPVLCKPLVACGTASAHLMWICFDVEGVLEYAQTQAKGCCVGGDDYSAGGFVCQEYVDHSEQLFKVFVCCDTTVTQTRPSLPNIQHHHHNHLHASNAVTSSVSTGRRKPLVFDNQKPVGPQIASWGLSQEQQQPNGGVPELSKMEVQAIVEAVRGVFGGSTLFGADAIRDSATGQVVVIDVNYFPSYKGCLSATQFFDAVLSYHMAH